MLEQYVFSFNRSSPPELKQTEFVESGEFCGDKEAQKINRYSQPLEPDVAKQQGDESVTWMLLVLLGWN
jgi:hypothetical protein